MVREEVVGINGMYVVTNAGYRKPLGNRKFVSGDLVWVEGDRIFGHERVSSRPVYVPSLSDDIVEGFIEFDVAAGHYNLCSLKDNFPILAQYQINYSDWNGGWLVYNQDHFAFMYFEYGQVRIRDFSSGTAIETTITLPDGAYPQARDAYFDANGDLNWAVFLQNNVLSLCKILQYKNSVLSNAYDFVDQFTQLTNAFNVEIQNVITEKFLSLHILQDTNSTVIPGYVPYNESNDGNVYNYNASYVVTPVDNPIHYTIANGSFSKPNYTLVPQIYVYLRDLWAGEVEIEITVNVTSTRQGTQYSGLLSEGTKTSKDYYWDSINKLYYLFSTSTQTLNMVYNTDFFKTVRLPSKEVVNQYIRCTSSQEIVWTVVSSGTYGWYDIETVVSNNDSFDINGNGLESMFLPDSGYTISTHNNEQGPPSVIISKSGVNIDVSEQSSYGINFNSPPVITDKDGIIAYLCTNNNTLWRIENGNITGASIGSLHNMQFPVIKISKSKFKKLFGW